MIVIADASKKVETLGAFPLPLEVVRFGLTATRNMIIALAADVGCEGDITRAHAAQAASRSSPTAAISSSIAHFGRIDEPEELDEALKLIPGVVENGLFIGIADLAVIAGGGGMTLLGADDGGGV